MKLHLGCGTIYLPGWVNVDLDSPDADMHLDLCERLPFEDGSAEIIYSEHFIEHIGRPEAAGLLMECRRVLKPGGAIRVSTPDMRFLAITYLGKNITEWGQLWSPANPCMLMNEGMRAWGHQFLYDADELERLFHESGFAQRQFQGWQQSTHPELRSLETRPFHQDLILEAIKPVEGDAIEPLRTMSVDGEQWAAAMQQSSKDYIETLERKLEQQSTDLNRLNFELVRAQRRSWVNRWVDRLTGKSI